MTAPTETSDSRRDMGRMRPAGQEKMFQRRPGWVDVLKNYLAGWVAVALTLPAILSGDVVVGATPLVGDAGSVLPDVVSPTVAAGAPLADCVDMQDSIDCAKVSPSSDIAGLASMAVAKVAYSANFAGMAFPAAAGVASSAVAGVVSPTVTVAVASSTDSMVVADSSNICSSQCDNDWLVPDDYVKDSDDVVFPGSSELGDPTVVIPPVVGIDPSVANDCSSGRDLNCVRAPASVDVFPEDQELPGENNEAIVVGAVGTGAPWFLTVWAEGTEVEFRIDTGCQVTILATSVFERMCASDSWVRSRLRPCGRRLISEH